MVYAVRRPLPVIVALLVLALATPAPSYAAKADLVPSLGPVVKAVPALEGGTREVHDFASYSLPGKDCATSAVVGTAVRGEQANYIGKRKPGQPAKAVAIVGVQVYASKHAADEVVLAVGKYTRKCRGPHVAGTVRNRLKAIRFKGKAPVGQRSVAYHVLAQQLGADGTVQDHLDTVWYVARSGRKVVMAVSGRRVGQATVDQAVALARLGLH